MNAMGGPVVGSASRLGYDAGLRAAGIAMVAGGSALAVLPAVGPLCPLRRVTGIPCPLCGMTTGVMAVARGDLAGAFAANPLAPLLVLVVLVAFVPPVWRAASQLNPPERLFRHRWKVPALLAAPLWVFQLHRFDYL